MTTRKKQNDCHLLLRQAHQPAHTLMLRKRATFEKEAHVLVKNGLDDLQIEDDPLDLSSWNNILIPNVESSFSQPKGAIDEAVLVVVSLNIPTSQLFLRVVVKSRANVFGGL